MAAGRGVCVHCGRRRRLHRKRLCRECWETWGDQYTAGRPGPAPVVPTEAVRWGMFFGLTQRQIAARFDVSPWTVWRAAKRIHTGEG